MEHYELAYVDDPVNHFLVSAGYGSLPALTEAQRSEMAKFKDGSQERREYLHKLASDAAIVEQQKQPLPAE